MDPSALPHAQGRGQPGPGTLFVVATPIGNLEDITLRALRVLGEVALVAAEDTRRTGNLLRHYKIATPLISLHEHNEQARLAQLVARLERGDSIALVSDAGTPGISDPGAVLVRAARAAGLRVDPIPGASAVTTVLSASGLSFDRFAYAGFPPIRSKDRKNWLQWVRTLADVPVVCFEAPHRIHRTLAELRGYLVDRPMVVARELTKAHEDWVFLPVGDTPDMQAIPARGEFVLVLGPTPERTRDKASASDAEILQLFDQTTQYRPAGSRRDAIRAVAGQLGISTRAVFDALERAKNESA